MYVLCTKTDGKVKDKVRGSIISLQSVKIKAPTLLTPAFKYAKAGDLQN